MQGVEERGAGKVAEPDHGGWPDEAAAEEAGERDADELGAEGEEDGEAPAEVDVVKGPPPKRDEGVGAVGAADGDVGHESDDDVLLDGEGARVEGPRHAERGEDGGRDEAGLEAADGVGKQLDDDGGQADDGAPGAGVSGDARIRPSLRQMPSPHAQEHVQSSAEGDEEQADDPGAWCVGRLAAVRVAHRGPDLLKGRVLVVRVALPAGVGLEAGRSMADRGARGLAGALWASWRRRAPAVNEGDAVPPPRRARDVKGAFAHPVRRRGAWPARGKG